jgi:hypothetical protein
MEIVGVLAGLYAGFAALTYFGQSRVLYPAPKTGDEPIMDGARLTEATGNLGRKVHAFFSPPPEADGVTVAHFHGNGEELADLIPLAWAFRRAQLGFFAVEYPGYGLAKDYEPSEMNLYADAEAALWHLHNGLGVPTDTVVLQGQSLGSGVATEMARRGHGTRLILISPFTSIPDLAARLVPVLPVRWLIRDRYDNASKAKELSLPVLIVHGTEDEIVPVDMGRRLTDLFPNADGVFVDGAHHNDLFVKDGRLIADRIAGFARGELRVH